MPYDLADIQSGLESLSSRQRNEGETAFPESAAMIAEVLSAGRNRRTAEARERRISDEAAERRRRETHPEEYIADAEIKEMAARLGEKFGIEAPREIIIREPVSVVCPHCSGVLPLPANMRMWTSTEVRAFADLLAECERIAANNREVA